MSAKLEQNPASGITVWGAPRPSVLDLIGRRRWLTDFLVAKSREGWLYFWNTSGIDPPQASRA